jgi:hypothetical protein
MLQKSVFVKLFFRVKQKVELVQILLKLNLKN